MPEQDRNGQVQDRREQHVAHGVAHGLLHGRVFHGLFSDLALFGRDQLAEFAVVRSHQHDREQRGGVQHAQQQNRARLGGRVSKGLQQHGGHRKAAGLHMAGCGHHAHGERGHQRQAHEVAHDGHQAQYLRDRHEHEKQPGEGQRLLEEKAQAFAHPLRAGAGGDDAQPHGSSGSATRALSTRSKCPGSWGLSMLASRGR